MYLYGYSNLYTPSADSIYFVEASSYSGQEQSDSKDLKRMPHTHRPQKG